MSCINKNILRFLLFAVLFTCKVSLTWATTDPPLTRLLKGSKDSVYVNVVSSNVDTKYFSLTSAQQQQTVTHVINNIVGVGIEEENTRYIPGNFSVTVVLEIIKHDQNNAITETLNKSFTINYDTSANAKYNSLSYYSFTNAYAVDVRIISIDSGNITWPVSKVLKVENTLTASRDYPFYCNAGVSNLQLLLDSPNDELTASWNPDATVPNPGQTEFDLEWAWVDWNAIDDFKSGNNYLASLFENNATRISITGFQYNIPLLYDDTGKVFVRVRPIQLKDDGQRVEGTWTWLINGNAQTPVSYLYLGHENDLNWQASTSYAEEGKRKSVLQYFDGSLRNRQTVTKDNSSNTTVVAESFYDYQGRAVIQVLPAPTLNSIIGYAHNFNKAVNEDGYPKWVYDKLQTGASVCSNPAKPFETTTGTANYYSPANPLVTQGVNKYIPDATAGNLQEAYAFTETRLSPDGRVASQGGVGFNYQLGSSHETKYFYESPAQEELDALFGTDAGVASHYFKNIVKDANGQYSVSYVDMHGRTVATSLAGGTPLNVDGTPKLDALASQNEVPVTKQLIDNETNIIIGNTITSSKSIVALKDGLYTFEYDLSAKQLDLLSCNSTHICYDCLYKLKITITSDCNNQPNFTTFADSILNFSPGQYPTQCNANELASQAFHHVWANISLPEGSYTVTKTLTLSSDAQNAYMDIFLANDTCKKFIEFYNNEYAILLAGSNCDIVTCTSCINALGSFPDFRARFVQQSGVPEPLDAQLVISLQASFNETKANCDRLCENNSDGMEVIRNIEEMMVQDVTPPYGQYAKLSESDRNFNIFKINDPANLPTSYGQTPLDVFPTTSGIPDYLRPVKHNLANSTATAVLGHYYDEFDQQEPLLLTGINAPDPQAFVTMFKTDWAKQLLPHHPEYRKLMVTKQQLQSTYQFEANIQKDTTWLMAKDDDFIDMLLNIDPYFMFRPTDKPLMHDKIFEYLPVQNSTTCVPHIVSTEHVGMWQIALASIFCRDKADGPACGIDFSDITTKVGCLMDQPTQPSPIHPLIHCETDWDKAWNVFKNMYISERKKFISKYLNSVARTFPTTYPNNYLPPYQLRFIDYSNPSVVSQNPDMGDIGHIIDNINNGGNITTEVAAAHQLAQDQYDLTCHAYANTWIAQLQACPQVGIISALDATWLIDRLQKICATGADEGHPLGSASVKPGDPPVIINGQQYSEFPDVIREYLQTKLSPGITQPFTSECFPWLITVPPPYDRQPVIANSYVLDKPTECECLRIQALQLEMNSPPVFPGTFSEYMEYRHGTYISQGKLDTLLSLCNGTFTCSMLPVPITIPPALQCRGTSSPPQTCISCQEYETIKIEFHQYFGQFAPVLQPQTQQDINLNYAFAHYANYKTGFVKRWTDYVAFENTCNAINPPISCADLSAALQDFYLTPEYLQNIVGLNCQQAFVNYFNNRFNVIYTFQIWVSKFLECGTVLDICTPTITCSSFTLLIDEYYNTYGVQVYNNANCQSLFVNFINQRLTSNYTYAQMEAIYNYTCNTGCGLNICEFPNHFLLTKVYNDFLAANGGHPWELPNCQDAFVQFFNQYFGLATPMNYNEILDLYRQRGGVDTDNCVPDISNMCNPPYTCDQLIKLYDIFYSLHSPIGQLPNCQQAFAAFFNDKYGTHYTYAEIEALYLSICHTPLVLCGAVTTDCRSLIALVREFILYLPDDTAPDQCQALFIAYFNTHFGTSYTTFDEINDLYKDCQFILNICGVGGIRRLTVDSKSLTEFLAWFNKEYPDPTTQFKNGECQDIFTARFNEQFISIYNYDEIAAYYLVQTGIVLNVCETQCDRLSDFITNFNTQYAALKLPAAARQDLFTFAYNNAFLQAAGAENNVKLQMDSTDNLGVPVTGEGTDPKLFDPVVNFGDLQKTMESCSTSISINYQPNVTISLYDQQVLLSLKQVYYVIHPKGMPDDCERDFAGWFNSVMKTTYDYKDLFNLYNNTCGSNAGFICTAPDSTEETKVLVKMAGATIPNTTIANLPPLLCGLNDPPNLPPVIDDSPCHDLEAIAYNNAMIKYELYIDSMRNVFDTAYHNKCMGAKDLESFTVTYQTSEYHYTLYYYDQAGSLVKTVPPAGVQRFTLASDLQSVKNYRANALINGPLTTNQKTPNHTLVTEYRYNTLKQVVAQKTPDAGISQFWYDRLGRLVVGQNSKQQPQRKYSYTLYDPLGRTVEVGELPKAAGTPAMTQDISENASTDPGGLFTWLHAGEIRQQITTTVYDQPYSLLCDLNNSSLSLLCQANTRNRVSYSYIKASDMQAEEWDAATFYSYDIHGNVDTLLQDYNAGYMKYKNPALTGTALTASSNLSGNRWKKIIYDYDLISGKVNEVAYQPGQADAFYHRYSYDAENRLTDVETSADRLLWEKDARYSYYKHGPLARNIIGQEQVQGIDYAYTLQGWLKGVNSTSVNQGILEIGQDGKIGGPNSNIGRDAYGYSLNYFNGEYKPIGGAAVNPFTVNTFSLTNSNGNKVANELFNGNIAAMMVNIPKLGEAQLYGYKYDQLNRIKTMDAFNGFNNTSNNWTSTPQPLTAYKENIAYDPNGNILNYQRKGDAARTAMDDMTYSYKPGTNQLDKVVDIAPDAATSIYDNYNDIKQGQANGNYQYDAIGNLISDVSEGISNIEWTVYGKIAQITKTDVTIKYSYDAAGNRISKDVNGKITYYVRDASGNTMSVYSKDAALNSGHLTQIEAHLYGSSRLGILNTNTDVQDPVNNNGTTIFIRGNKFFELTNHLGNIYATVSDKKIGHDAGNGTIDYYTADVVTATDYYPFGMGMPSRKFSQASNNYRYGFNGQEKSDDVAAGNYTAEFWEYDSRIGRRWNRDPKYTFGLSEYSTFNNNPILISDIKGDQGEKPGSGPGDPLPRNPYSGKIIIDPLKNHPFYTSFNRPENAPVDRNTTAFTDLPYVLSGGDKTHAAQGSMNSLGSYSTNPGFSPLNMKGTQSGKDWNEFTDSKNYFNFTGTPKGGIVNLLLGNYIKGIGPQNYIFPVNGEVSKSLLGSRILGDAFSDWQSGGSKDNFEKKIVFGGSRQAELISQGKVLSLENFVGSANVTINKTSANEIIVRIYNVTSITSGDIAKHLPGGTWMPSVVADPSNSGAQPYSNILQIYQLSFTGYKMSSGYTQWITNDKK